MLIKGFDKDLKCRGFQFEVGEVYEVDGAPKLCSNGFHYCDNIADVHRFYNVRKDNGNRFCEIEAMGEIDKGNDKLCTNKIKIVREIIDKELDSLINYGKDNAGIWNTGDWNQGDSNTGDWNLGDWNSGGFNSCNYSNGFFCTKEPTINIFNMPTNLTLSEFYESDYYDAIINGVFKLTEWICYSEEEKANDEIKKKIGGYLKRYTYHEACANWWNSLCYEDKEIIKSIPNFNADIFKEITGIDV